MDGEASLDVVDDPEVLAGLVDLDHVHETSGELGVGPGLAINLDQPLLEDGLNLLGAEGVLQTVPKLQSSFIPDLCDRQSILHLLTVDSEYVMSFTDPLKKERSKKARYPLRKGLYLVT